LPAPLPVTFEAAGFWHHGAARSRPIFLCSRPARCSGRTRFSRGGSTCSPPHPERPEDRLRGRRRCWARLGLYAILLVAPRPHPSSLLLAVPLVLCGPPSCGLHPSPSGQKTCGNTGGGKGIAGRALVVPLASSCSG